MNAFQLHRSTRTPVLGKTVALHLFGVLIAASVLAQQPATKRPLTHADYDSWRAIQGQGLSRDGKFLAYALVPQDGDGEVVVRNLSTGAEWRHPRGAQPTRQPDPTGELPQGPPVFAGRPTFTADGRFVVFSILPTKAETEKARKQKKKPEEMPKNAMGIMDVSTGEVARVERVKSFQVPETGTGFLAYLLEPKAEEKKAEEKKSDAPAAGNPSERRRRDKKKEYGSELVLRNLTDKSERTFHDVLEYSISKDAKRLAYAVFSKNEETNGTYVVTPGAADPPVALLSGKGKYSKLTWDEKQNQLAFLSDRDDSGSAQPKYKLYYTDARSPAIEIASASGGNFKPGMVISERAAITFSLEGDRIFFGVAPPPEPEKEETEDASSSDDKVLVDLWHWKDDYIQPMQKVRAERDRNRSFRAVVNLKDKKCIQLADEAMAEITPTNDSTLR